MKTIEINTKRWTRLIYHDESTGKRCAIGFLHEQFGVAAERELPDTVWEQIMFANDNLTGKSRRLMLRELFRQAGYKVRFTNVKKHTLARGK